MQISNLKNGAKKNRLKKVTTKQLFFFQWKIDQLVKQNRDYYVTLITKVVRKYLQEYKYCRIKNYLVKVQSIIRMFLCRRRILREKHQIICAIRIQRCFRNRTLDYQFRYFKNCINQKNNKLQELMQENYELKEKISKSSLICPITHEIPIEPVFCTKDGKIYEKSAILFWLKNNNTSPYNRKIISSKNIISMLELCNVYNTHKIYPGRHLWYSEKNVVHWILEYTSGKTFSQNMYFLEASPTERYGFKINIYIDQRNEALSLEFLNSFGHDSRLLYPIQKSIKIEINETSATIPRENLMIGCWVDLYNNDILLKEGLIVELCDYRHIKFEGIDVVLPINYNLQPRCGQNDKSIFTETITMNQITTIRYYGGNNNRRHGWGWNAFETIGNSVLPNGKIHVKIKLES